MKIIEAAVSAPEAKIGVVISRFNKFINLNLLDGAISSLKRIGQVNHDNITVIWVPGAFELPLATETLIKTNKYDAIIALGTVIRGHTSHCEYIANEASAGIARISINNNIPIAFGLLTTENIEQAIERSGTKLGNKGSEAAITVLEMINVLKAIKLII
ncbi:6,7-dimethyl-8-ribityllumazine synthase [Candidatus Pantoea edessiphila]|uniref:6,7-dimethyl-8-ribityllumazine synthase n=1 Tax=Candidatus Pantoea edessiphila TaxID=2044610 RepID=A0A2P5SXF3_9GAMM|nr:6,7-dimethyl-8-ribityllumazine synthase [Candidatus Pantoea edessiphila]MBK4775858.1 6,7-dimethyl-8-ribityllumazine synthase [Pantoea sp. Edef]PPI87027.1 6,7-dimethyl-8-ribityllumazine synthase [Candidatus Pantoea edessiphila]